MAEQIHAEETSGIKELAKTRKAVKEFLKKGEKAIKGKRNKKNEDATDIPPPELRESLARLDRKLKQVEFHYPRPPSYVVDTVLA